MAFSGLAGKVCVVTGSSSGFGRCIAIQLAKNVASVVLTGRNEEQLNTVLAECIKESGGFKERFITVKRDLVDSSTRNNIIQKAVEKFGCIDILVNNAGVASGQKQLIDITPESFDEIINTNLKSVFFLTQKAVPYLEKTKGNIVTVSSFLSTYPSSSSWAYGMSKAGLDHVMKCFALTLAPKGIRVNVVNPSWSRSNVRRYMVDEAAIEKKQAKNEARESALQPLGQRCVTHEEVANAVLFLASSSASFITGQRLFVEGGRMFGGIF